MIMEFLGPPGAGKTTLARKIEENTDFKIIKIKSRVELIWLNFIFLLKYPKKFFRLLYFILFNSKNWLMFYYKFTNLFLHANAKYLKSLRIPNSIIDQGHLQSIISIPEEIISEKEIKKAINFAMPVDLLVVLDIDFNMMSKRIKDKMFISEKLGEKYLLNKLSILHENFKNIKESVSLKPNVLIVNLGKNQDKIYSEVLNFIKYDK